MLFWEIKCFLYEFHSEDDLSDFFKEHIFFSMGKLPNNFLSSFYYLRLFSAQNFQNGIISSLCFCLKTDQFSVRYKSERYLRNPTEKNA